MRNRAIQAVRSASCVTIALIAPMMLPGAATPAAPVDAIAAPSIQQRATPVAGMLIPARTRLIIDYRRIALA
jgi:hypothetical protein